LVSKTVIIILLITALLLSSTAVYITITKIDEALITGSFNKAGVGVYVKPERGANVGITVIPPEEPLASEETGSEQ